VVKEKQGTKSVPGRRKEMAPTTKKGSFVNAAGKKDVFIIGGRERGRRKGFRQSEARLPFHKGEITTKRRVEQGHRSLKGGESGLYPVKPR